MQTSKNVRPRALFVDDDHFMLAAFARSARRFGFDVVTNADPIAALQLIRGGEFSAVVSDYSMPRLDGLGFLAEVRAASPGCVRFLLTGHGTFELGVRAVECGAVDRLLSKPCDAGELLLALRQAVEHRRLVERTSELTELCRRRLECSSPLSVIERDSDGAIVIGSAGDELGLLAELEELLRPRGAAELERESA